MARADKNADRDRVKAERNGTGLDAPKGLRSNTRLRTRRDSDRFGRFTEWIARAMGTPGFLIILSLFCLVWLVWNSTVPLSWRFDSQAFGFTVLTLILSLQASYAAPLILLAQNRQDDRDRVQIEQDRQRAERNLADTEYLAREVVALRLAMRDLASKDFIRNELRALLDELEEAREAEAAAVEQAAALRSTEAEATDPDEADEEIAAQGRQGLRLE